MGEVTRTSRLELPQVTLMAIDAHRPLNTAISMTHAMRQITFAGARLVTSTETGAFKPFSGSSAINVLAIRDPATRHRVWRESFLLTQLGMAFDTPYCLHMEWDSCVANPRAWNPDWLQYDFIGAPWPWPYKEATCATPCSADNCVGNTGFALMSKRFCVAAAAIAKPTPQELVTSDAYLCRTIRPQLEEKGMKFAPEAVAEAFSCENRFYSGQFGWHGKGTMNLNGWKWPLII